MNIRRYYVPNSIVFITQVVDKRKPLFADPSLVNLLKTTRRNVKLLYPFTMLGYVFLPDHFHLLIRPRENVTFSRIVPSTKANFTKTYKAKHGTMQALKFWQKGFWDHVTRDEVDFERHRDYIHYNPVHHGYTNKPEKWLHSSFIHWQKRNAYPARWGWTLPIARWMGYLLKCMKQMPDRLDSQEPDSRVMKSAHFTKLVGATCSRTLC